MNKKKLLALLMALVMTLTLVPVTAFAAELSVPKATVSAPTVQEATFGVTGTAYDSIAFHPGLTTSTQLIGKPLAIRLFTSDSNESGSTKQYFDNWYADFAVSFNKPMEAEDIIIGGNTYHTVPVIPVGYYKAFGDYIVGLAINKNLTADEDFWLLADGMGFFGGGFASYPYIRDTVQNFFCGAVLIDDDFLDQNSTYSDGIATYMHKSSFPNGLKMSVKLRLYSPSGLTEEDAEELQAKIGGDYQLVKFNRNGEGDRYYIDVESSTFDITPKVRENAVARIGTAHYTTLEDAIAAANPGDTITLLQDISVTAPILISESITIDGDGKTITSSADYGFDINTSNVAVTLKNLTIGGTKLQRAIQVESDKDNVTLLIDNVTATATYYTVNIRGDVDNLNMTITNSNLTGWGAVNLWGKDGTVNISNSTLTGKNDKGYNADGWNDFGTVVVEGDTTGQTDAHASAYNISISDTRIIASQTTGNQQFALLYNNPSVNNDITLTNCTIELGSDKCSFLYNESGDGVDHSTTKIKNTFVSGTTDTLPELPEGYTYVDVENEYKQVALLHYVAQIGNVKYETLAAAIAAVPAEGTATTIEMIADSAEPEVITIAAGKNITLDLAGHTVSHTSALKSVYFITNSGNLTVKDSGSNGKITMTAVADTGYSVENVTVLNEDGTLSLQSGTIENLTGGGLTYAVKNSSNAWANSVVSTFNMTGGTVSAPQGDAALRVYQNTGISWKVESKNYVNISGGTIKDTGIFVDTVLYTKNQDSTDFAADDITKGCVIDTAINITGGTVNGLIDMKIRHPYSTVMNISDGDFTNAELRVRKYTAEYGKNLSAGTIPEPSEPMMNISGGKWSFKIDGRIFVTENWSAYTQPYYVTGGVFNVGLNNYNSIKFADGKTGITNTAAATKDDYPFTVGTAATPVAQIGEGANATQYTTLQAAFDAVKNGETIILLDNLTQDDGVLFDHAGVSAKLDLNGNTFTVNYGSNVNSRAIRIDNGTLEVYGGTIVAAGAGTTSSNGTGCYGAFRVEAGGKLIAHDLTLSNARPWGLNVKVCGGKAELTNVTINSSYGGGIEVTEKTLGGKSQTGEATLTNCTFTQENYFDHCSTCLSVSGGSKLIIDGGSYTGDNYALYVFSSGGEIEVKDGTFSGNKNGVAIIAGIDTKTYPQYTGGLKISGGNFTGGYNITSPAYMSITGGVFDHDPSTYVADGYEAVANQPTSGKWQVGKVQSTDIAKTATGNSDTETTYTASRRVVDENEETIATSEQPTVTVTLSTPNNSTVATNNKLPQYDQEKIVAKALEVSNAETMNVSIDVKHDTPEVVGSKITYEVHPEATVTSGSETVGTFTVTNDMLSGQTFTIKLPVPEALQTYGWVKVTHMLNNGGTVEYAKLQVVGGYVTIADVTEFSEFELEMIEEGSTATAAYGFTLALKNKIEIPLYVYNLSANADNYHVYYSYTDANNQLVEEYVDLSDSAYSVGNGWYRVVVASFSARQLHDEVTVILYTGDNRNNTDNQIYNGTYSIYKYCDNMVNHGGTNTESLKTLCKAMMDYGTAAQWNFGYTENVSDTYYLLNSTPDMGYMGSQYSNSFHTQDSVFFNYIGATLSLKSQTELNFYFGLMSGNIEDYTFKVNGVDASATPAGSYYRVTASGITAKNLDKQVTVTVTNIYTNREESYSYSPLNYAYYIQQHSPNDTLKTVCRGLYLYWQAANDYLN